MEYVEFALEILKIFNSNDDKVKELIHLMGDDKVLQLHEVSDNFNLTFKSETGASFEIAVDYGMPISDLVKLIKDKTGEANADLYLSLFNDPHIYVGNDHRPLW